MIGNMEPRTKKIISLAVMWILMLGVVCYVLLSEM